jgi:hypothetical protein
MLLQQGASIINPSKYKVFTLTLLHAEDTIDIWNL